MIAWFAVAMASEPSPNSVQLDLGLAVAGVAYEREFLPWMSGRLAAQVTSPWYTGRRLAGMSLEARPFFFPWKGTLVGVYVSPFFRGAAIKAVVGDESRTGWGWTAGATAGLNVEVRRLLFRVGGGAQYWAYEPEPGFGLTGFWPDVDLIVGYRF